MADSVVGVVGVACHSGLSGACGPIEGNPAVCKVDKIHKDIDSILVKHGFDTTTTVNDKTGMGGPSPAFALNAQMQSLGDYSMLDHSSGNNRYIEENITSCCTIYATSSDEMVQTYEPQSEFNPQLGEAEDISFSNNDRREEFFGKWYDHFGNKRTLLADILDPSGKYYWEYQRTKNPDNPI